MREAYLKAKAGLRAEEERAAAKRPEAGIRGNGEEQDEQEEGLTAGISSPHRPPCAAALAAQQALEARRNERMLELARAK